MDTRRKNVAISSMLDLLIALAGIGCWSDEADQTQSVQPATRALIGGFAANDPGFDALGSLSLRYSDPWSPSTQVVCSGALIGPRTFLTAKQCLDGAFSDPNERLVVTIGPDAAHPTTAYDVVDFEGAPGDRSGGFTGYGHDVAVVYLAAAASGVRPIELASLSEVNLGEELAVAGFGLYDNTYETGRRRIGGVHLQALEGRIWEILLGSVDAFYESIWHEPIPPECAAPGDAGDDVDCYEVEAVRRQYWSQRLESLGELIAGGSEGDIEPCLLDTGAPLFRADADARLLAYGIVNGFLSSSGPVCGHATVFAGFGEEVRQFLERTKDWVDPCSDETWMGSCTGTIARGCSNPSQGPRHIVTIDCIQTHHDCDLQSDGTPGCVGEIPGP